MMFKIMFKIIFIILTLWIMPGLAKTDLAKLAKNCDAGKQKDCAKLQDIARNNPDALVRAEATALIDDQGVLGSIARADKADAVREAAVKKLTDQSLLAEIAMTDSASVVRVVATGQLTDEELLRKISENVDDTPVQDAVKSRLLVIDLCRSPWILSSGVPCLVDMEPGIGVEVLEFRLNGMVEVKANNSISFGETTFSLLDPNTLSIRDNIRGTVSPKTIILRNNDREGVYVRAKLCQGEEIEITATLVGGPTFHLPRVYCPVDTLSESNH
ncbi:MAG TPA: hypothetical protein VM123_06900 [archaeon]|nr:hypothetical protein [archaeon]